MNKIYAHIRNSTIWCNHLINAKNEAYCGSTDLDIPFDYIKHGYIPITLLTSLWHKSRSDGLACLCCWRKFRGDE